MGRDTARSEIETPEPGNALRSSMVPSSSATGDSCQNNAVDLNSES